MIHDLEHTDVLEYESTSVALYPNPVGGRLMVKTENMQSVEVYNLVGQLVATTTMETVDMSNLDAGIYFVRITADGKTVTQRVVKQ